MADLEIIEIDDCETIAPSKRWNMNRTNFLISRMKRHPLAWKWSDYFLRDHNTISEIINKLKNTLKTNTKEIIVQIEYLGRQMIHEIERQIQEGEKYQKWIYFDQCRFILEDWEQVCKLRKKFVKILAEYPEIWRRQDSVTQHEDWKKVMHRMQEIINKTPYFAGKTVESKMLCSLWNNTYLGAVMNSKLVMHSNEFSIRSFPRMFHYYSDYMPRTRPEDVPYAILNDKKQLKYAKVKYPNTTLLRNNWPPEAFYSTQFCSYNNYDILDDKIFKPDLKENDDGREIEEMFLFMFILKIYRRVRDQSFYKKMTALWNVIHLRFLEFGMVKKPEELKEKWESIIDRIKKKLVMGKIYPTVSQYNLTPYEAEIYFYFSEVIDSELPSVPVQEIDNEIVREIDKENYEIYIEEKKVPSETVYCLVLDDSQKGSTAAKTGTVTTTNNAMNCKSPDIVLLKSPEIKNETSKTYEPISQSDTAKCSENDDCSIVEEKIENNHPGCDSEMEETLANQNPDCNIDNEEINYIKSLLMETS